MKDIDEGCAGHVTEVGVAFQAPQQRLFEGLSGDGPQLLLPSDLT